jgi:hypothetical protein
MPLIVVLGIAEWLDTRWEEELDELEGRKGRSRRAMGFRDAEDGVLVPLREGTRGVEAPYKFPLDPAPDPLLIAPGVIVLALGAAPVDDGRDRDVDGPAILVPLVPLNKKSKASGFVLVPGMRTGVPFSVRRGPAAARPETPEPEFDAGPVLTPGLAGEEKLRSSRSSMMRGIRRNER